DDSYLMLGKAYYLNGETDKALEAFQYVISNYGKAIRKTSVKKAHSKATAEQEKARKKAAKDRKAEIEAQKKEREKQIKENIAEQERIKKERETAQKNTKKEAEKRRKEREKQQKAEKKERDRITEERKKITKKNIERRKKGLDPLPLPEYKTKVNGQDTNTETKVEPETNKDKKQKNKEKEQAEAKQKADAEAAKKAEAAQTDTTTAETTQTTELVAGKEYKSGFFSFLKHRPATYESQIWLARTYIETDKLPEAKKILEKIENDATFPRKLRKEVNTLFAYYYLHAHDKQTAREYLLKAARETSKRKGKARLYYILGQIDKDGNEAKNALKNFRKVLRSRPNYPMEFNARMNIIALKLQTGNYSPNHAIAIYERMAKEDKNIEYADQIYAAMAEIALTAGNENQAEGFLKKATSTTGVNPQKKSFTYLKLADLNYQKGRYTEAGHFYDSTLLNLPKTHLRYEEIKTRAEVLGQLAIYETTITTQDSLQAIAKLPERERDAKIDKVVDQLLEENQRKMEELARIEAERLNQNPEEKNNSSSDFYFYNPITRSTGYNEFKQKWGNRPLTDNWRQSAKQQSQMNGETLASDLNNNLTREDMLGMTADQLRNIVKSKIPLTAKALAESDTAIAEALYKSGLIYRNSLKLSDKAETQFTTLLNRYPASQYAPPALYNLYLMAQQNGNTTKVNQYKTQLQQDYANTPYAQLVNDPNYTNNAHNEVLAFYEESFALYKAGNFSEVRKRQTESETRFTNNPITTKFALLNAIAVGGTETREAYIEALNKFVAQYGNTATNEVKKAQEILQYLANNPNQDAPITTNYTYTPDKTHYIVIAFDKYSNSISTTTNNVSNFNQENFSVEKLKVTQQMLDLSNQILLVKEFPTAEKAMFYYKALQNKEVTVFKDLDTTYKFFAISKSNFTEYFKQKDKDKYLAFFYANYMK
ncbi:MAG TPA: tetratricopeptide repeat protein, partial [Chitinophagales bacterium]|nr:tetratricopeptide repeat protein [Chitinophagales bacterium]